MIKEYINSINKNGTRNMEKGGKIKKGYDFLIYSVFVFGGILVSIIILFLIEYLEPIPNLFFIDNNTTGELYQSKIIFRPFSHNK
jgi:hypothetical protein